MIPFVDFVQHLGVTLEKGQVPLCKIFFDGQSPSDLPAGERDMALDLLGGVDNIPASSREVLVLLAGGRGGKTYLCSLYILYLALSVDISHLAPGEKAFAALVAPSLDLAQQNLNYISGAVHSDDKLRKCIVDDTSTELVILQKPGGKPVSIRTFAAARGGVSGRGKSLVGVLMSETCFFRDAATGVVNDEAIFKAASPRVVKGGKTVIESTPWVQTGLMYDLYKNNYKHPKNALVVRAPTRTLRSNEHILSIVDREYSRDPENAAVEFGAEWGGTSSSEFFTDDDLTKLFSLYEPAEEAKQGEKVASAADLAFVKNSATLCTLAVANQEMRVTHLEERKPTEEVSLVPSDVCTDFCATLRRKGAKSVVVDGHYRETMREYTNKIGCALIDSCGPAERFTLLRTAIRSGNVRMYVEHPLARRLRNQLAGIRVIRTSGGNYSVHLPRGVDGSHGDVADVLARAVWGFTTHGGADQQAADEEGWHTGEKEMAEKLRKTEEDEDTGTPWWVQD